MFNPVLQPDDSVGDKEADKARLAELSARLAALQDRLYAARHDSLLLVLQGMDTSGKNGTIRSVFGGVNPLGVRAVSYRVPTAPEAEHDFLWRHHRDAPSVGEIVIFNRSHYEAVVVEYVIGLIDDAERERRYGHIRAFEQLLIDRGTTLIKCFLHISKDEQRRRLRQRRRQRRGGALRRGLFPASGQGQRRGEGSVAHHAPQHTWLERFAPEIYGA